MKKYLLILPASLFFVFFINSFPLAAADENKQNATGNPAIDAITLIQLSQDTSPMAADKIVGIINFYSTKGYKSYEDLKNASINVFVDEYKKQLITRNDSLRVDSKLISEIDRESGGDPEATGFSPAIAVDAIGTFIAQRFKDELTIEFLQKFRAYIENEPVCKDLLPATQNILISTDPFMYNAFITSIQQAVKDDINKLPYNFLSYSKNNIDNLPSFIGSENGMLSLTIYEAICAISKGGNTHVVLNDLSSSVFLKKISAENNLKEFLMFTSLVSRSLGDGSGKWIKKSMLNPLLENADAAKIFIGLLMMQEEKRVYINGGESLFKTIKFNTKTLEELISNKIDDVQGLIIYFQHASTIFESLAEDFENMSANMRLEDASRATAAIIEYANKVSKTIIELIPSQKICTTYLSGIIPQANNITELTNKLKKINSLLDHAIKEEYMPALNDLIALFDNNQNNFVVILSKYGIFMTTLAEAETKEEMLEAIKTAALPVGSYRIKRTAKTNIALNTYAGGFVGSERFISAPADPDVEQKAFTFGFTAPVGLAYSWTNKPDKPADGTKITTHKTEAHYSNTIFLSLIDVGAVTAFRIGGDSTEVLPEVTWANFLSPGIYYIGGFPKTPISLSLGVQYGPQIKTINDLGGDNLTPLSIRFGLLVDIPVFSFNTKPRDE
ncbi:MAG: hypothetical protein ACHQFW_10550 [Chitinophagales bacterium]